MFLLSTLVAPAAWAVPPSPTARAKAEAAYQLGVKAFEGKRFDVALKHFEDAYLLDPVPILLYNIARAHEELKQYAEASRYLSRYLDRLPPDAADRSQVEQRLTALRAAAQAPEPQPEPPAPPALPQKDPPGVTPATQISDTPEEKSNWLSWTLMGTGGVCLLIGVGAWAGAVEAVDEAKGYRDQIAAGADNEAELRERYNDAAKRAEDQEAGAWLMGGLGLVAGAVGWYLYEGDDAPAVSVVPTVNGLGVAGRF